MIKFYLPGLVIILWSCTQPNRFEATAPMPELTSIVAADTTTVTYLDTLPVSYRNAPVAYEEDVLFAEEEPADVFKVTILNSEELNWKEKEHSRLSEDGNFLFSDFGMVAYKKTGDSTWTTILGLPEMNYTAEYIDFDGKGEKEILLRGQNRLYGSGGGTSTESISLVNIDSIPVMIFDALHHCSEESFGDKWNEGDGGFEHSWQREITISQGIIEVGRLEKSDDSDAMSSLCDMPELEEGTYIWKNGRFQREE